MDNNITRCKRCILPESFPGLTFDELGVCDKCRQHERRWGSLNFEKSEAFIEKVFDSVRRKRHEYDCIIGLSGGKDSSYVAYLCTKKYKLNPLCVTFDNGFLSAAALENMGKLIPRLNVAHISFKPDWELMKRLYRHFLLTTGEFCTPCNVGINSTLYYMAKKYRVPLIISGVSPYTDSEADINVYHVSTEYFRNVAKGHFDENEIKDFLHCRTLKRGIYHLTGRIKFIQLPLYVKWDEREIISILNRELGWKVESSITTEHTDCIMSPLKEYLRIKEFGFSEKTQKFSALVRNGFMSREEALAKAECFESGISEDKSGQLNGAMQLLDLSGEELARAVTRRQGPYIYKSTKLLDSLAKKFYYGYYFKYAK